MKEDFPGKKNKWKVKISLFLKTFAWMKPNIYMSVCVCVRRHRHRHILIFAGARFWEWKCKINGFINGQLLEIMKVALKTPTPRK